MAFSVPSRVDGVGTRKNPTAGSADLANFHNPVKLHPWL